MRTIEEIKRKTYELMDDANILHRERKQKIKQFGGISEEENRDFLFDISTIKHQIEALNWAIGLTETL